MQKDYERRPEAMRHDPAEYPNPVRFEKAIAAYRTAIALNDVYPQTHHNLANVYERMGRPGLAEEEFLKALL